jgi:hypothetical protein
MCDLCASRSSNLDSVNPKFVICPLSAVDHSFQTHLKRCHDTVDVFVRHHTSKGKRQPGVAILTIKADCLVL